MKDGRVQSAGTGTTSRESLELALRGVVVACALSTALIHASLGGLLFTLNAVGYLTFGVALVVPLALARRLRWLARLALIAFTATTIVGWLLVGARFPLAYLDKAIELVLVALLLADIWLADGGPKVLGYRILREIASLGRGRAGSSPTARQRADALAPDDGIPERKKVA
jgi:hypothetical protein